MAPGWVCDTMANFKSGERKTRPDRMWSRQVVLKSLRSGMSVKEALVEADRSRSWYEAQRREDEVFTLECDQAKAMHRLGRKPVTHTGSFAEFREEYLGVKTWPHQQCWIDLLEGRDPQWMHQSFKYERGERDRILVNVPPAHSKSTTLNVDYVTYRICKNPNESVVIVSKTATMAKKFLFAIKQRLTHPKYAKLQVAFAPEGGFKAASDMWTADRIYLGGEARDSGEKDPTVEALGMGGQIYGNRSSLIICDDCVDLSNAGDWAKQLEWLSTMVDSRLAPGDILAVVGTRVAANDLYRELRNPDNFADGRSPWTYLAQPAILETPTDDPKDWLTLWPRSDMPFPSKKDAPDADGFYPRWTGENLKKVRGRMSAAKWAMMYQQQDVSSDSVFNEVLVSASINRLRRRGPLNPKVPGHPEHPEGFFRVCGMDPAMSGDTAAIAYALDRTTGERYVTDVKIMPAPTPARIRDLIYTWTDAHTPHEWVIESNAFQLFLTQDEEVKRFLGNRGIPLIPHHTGNNKQDPEFGVASLAPLFGSLETDGVDAVPRAKGDTTIELPSVLDNEDVKKLVEQLVTWDPTVPTRKRKQDALMALWFCELRARLKLRTTRASQTGNFMKSKFTSPRDAARRSVVALDEWFGGNPTMAHL